MLQQYILCMMGRAGGEHFAQVVHRENFPPRKGKMIAMNIFILGCGNCCRVNGSKTTYQEACMLYKGSLFPLSLLLYLYSMIWNQKIKTNKQCMTKRAQYILMALPDAYRARSKSSRHHLPSSRRRFCKVLNCQYET